MSAFLKLGQAVHAEFSGLPCQVESLLGTGGQGEVYRALLGSTPLALKWYDAASATAAQKTALEALVKKGPPSDMFLWPLDLASSLDVPGFGYLMPLRPAHFKSGADLTKRRIDPSFRITITAAINLANGFLQLHAAGLAYRDINFGNFFLDPATGDVLICDLDNVGIDGQPHNTIGGTMRFMAPEIVRGEAYPSTHTDQFSLAVLLHFLFFMDHPLEGQRDAAIVCPTPADLVRLYGTEPRYLADPKDTSNRPVRGRHDNFLAFWPIYPKSIRALFTRAFTVGLHDPANRVKESEWRAALSQLRDYLVYCGHCGRENFFDPDPAQPGDAGHLLVLSPDPPVSPVAGFRQNRRHAQSRYPAVPPSSRRPAPLRLFQGRRRGDAPSQGSRIWGLKNLSGSPWVCSTPANQTCDVPSGRSVTLSPGTRIQFGKVTGEVKLTGHEGAAHSPQ